MYLLVGYLPTDNFVIDKIDDDLSERIFNREYKVFKITENGTIIHIDSDLEYFSVLYEGENND